MSKNWCGEHKPDSGACLEHNLNWEEIHSKELLIEWGVPAVFYCPIMGCDRFDYIRTEKSKNILVNTNNLLYIFIHAVRLKILYHKLARFEGDGK